MNTYELTILFADGDESNRERVIKMIESFAKKTKGEVNKQESWGSKRLAYPIKKMGSAVYEHFLLTLEGSAQVELEKTFKLDESLLRYMFIRV